MEAKSETTTVRLPRDLVEKIRELADRHDRSLSAELREALRHYLRTAGIILAVLAAVALTPAAANAKWVQVRGPVLTATLPWEGIREHRPTVQEPTVIWDHGRYRLWYTGGWHNARLGYAESRDGIHWRKRSTPVLWDATHSNVVKTSSGFMIFSVRHNGVLTIAYSRDGIHAYGRRTLFRPIPGTWQARTLANTFAWKTSDGWKLLYEGKGVNAIWQTGLAHGNATASRWQRAATHMQIGFGGMAGGPWRDGRCLYFHASKFAVLPTDIYRRCGPDLHHLGQPELVLTREQAWQFDQVADPSIAHAPSRRALMLFDGMNNTPGQKTGMIGAAWEIR